MKIVIELKGKTLMLNGAPSDEEKVLSAVDALISAVGGEKDDELENDLDSAPIVKSAPRMMEKSKPPMMGAPAGMPPTFGG